MAGQIPKDILINIVSVFKDKSGVLDAIEELNKLNEAIKKVGGLTVTIPGLDDVKSKLESLANSTNSVGNSASESFGLVKERISELNSELRANLEITQRITATNKDLEQTTTIVAKDKGSGLTVRSSDSGAERITENFEAVANQKAQIAEAATQAELEAEQAAANARIELNRKVILDKLQADERYQATYASILDEREAKEQAAANTEIDLAYKIALEKIKAEAQFQVEFKKLLGEQAAETRREANYEDQAFEVKAKAAQKYSEMYSRLLDERDAKAQATAEEATQNELNSAQAAATARIELNRKVILDELEQRENYEKRYAALLDEREAKEQAIENEKIASIRREANYEDQAFEARAAKAAAAGKIHDQGFKEDSRRGNADDTFTQFILDGGKLKDSEVAVDNLTGKIQKVLVAENEATGVTLKLNDANKNLSVSTKQLENDFDGASNSIANAAGKVFVWTIATGAVFGAIHAIGGAVRSFEEVENATVSLSRVGQGFAASNGIVGANAAIIESSRDVILKLQDLKIEYGVTGDAANQAAVTFAKLGLSEQQVLEATKAALQAEVLSGVDAAKNAELLSTAFLSFKESASSIPDILNKLNVVQDTTRVRMDQLLEANQRAGAVFREAGGTFEQFTATTAVVAQATGRTGAEIGNALKFIGSKLGDATVQEKLFTEAGIGIRDIEGNLKPINDVLGELAVRFQTLSKAQQADIEVALAGTRQRNILQVALENYYQIQQKVIDQLQASNTVERDVAEVKATLASSLQQLTAAFEKLGQVLISSGIGQVLTKLVQALTFAVDKFASLGLGALLVVGAIATYTAAMFVAGLSTTGMQAALVGLIERLTVANIAIANGVGSLALYSGATVTAATTTTAFSGAVTGLAGSLLVLLPVLAPIIAIAAAIAVIDYGLGKLGKKKLDVGPDSDFGKEQKTLTDEVTRDSNLSKAEKAKSDEANVASLQLDAIQKAEESGFITENEAIKKRIEIGTALVRAFHLEGEERAKAIRGDLDSFDATNLASEAKQKQTEKLNEAIETQKRAVKSARDAAANAELEADKKRATDKVFEENTSGILGIPKYTTGKFAEYLFNKTETTGQSQQELDAIAATTKAKKEENDQTLKGLEAEKSKSEEAEKQQHIYESINSIREKAKAIESETDKNLIPGIAAAANEPEKIARELDSVNQKLNAIKNNDAIQKAIKTDPNIIGKDFKEHIEDPLLKKKEELEEKLLAAPIKIAVKLEESGLKARLGLEKNIAEQLAEARVPKEERGLVKAQVDLQTNESQIDRLKEAARNLDDSIGGRDRVVGNLPQEEQKEVLTLMERRKAILEESQALSLQTASLEAKIVEQKLAGEIKILQEKKKQTDEARKALGLLSDEDLLRTRILAGKIQSGEFKAPTTSEFLNLDADSRKFLTGFNKEAPGLGVLDNVNPSELFGANAFTGRSGKADREILSASEVKEAFDSLKNLKSFNGQSLDATVTSAVVNAQSINVINPGGLPTSISNSLGGGPASNQTTVTVNIQGIEETANRIGNSVIAALTNGINDIVRNIGDRMVTAPRHGRKEMPR